MSVTSRALHYLFVLDDSVDFDGFVVPDRMETLLSSALENHRIRSTRERLSTARRFHLCVAGYMIEVRMAGEDDLMSDTLKPRDVMFSRRIGADCSSAVSIRCDLMVSSAKSTQGRSFP